MIEAIIEPTYESWRARARALALAGVAPWDVWWSADSPAPRLPGVAKAAPPAADGRIDVPRRFVQQARLAARHRAADRWDLLYRVLWRLAREDHALLARAADPDVTRLESLARQVREDVHRMKAFVRFRAVRGEDGERLVAHYRPDHDVAVLAAPHFAKRYPDERWSIITPDTGVHWDGRRLTFGPGAAGPAPRAGTDAGVESLWREYYAAAFNPARANPRKLNRDLPVRFRAALPEAPEIPPLLEDAGTTTAALRAGTGGGTERALVPPTADLGVLQQSAECCRACPLYERATRTVFGEGPASARLVLVGEQPGDVEDRAGRPFVGPAGELLDGALSAAGIDRSDIYLTNAVKHFAWEPRGKWRIHRTPRLSEMRACRPWLEAELNALSPRLVVCLGGTAARTLLGPQARVGALRGRVLTGYSWAPAIVVTEHPAAVLRAGDGAVREAAFSALVADLILANAHAA